MNPTQRHQRGARFALIAISFSPVFVSLASAQCTLTEGVRKFEGAERKIVRMENEKIIVEVAPELEGRIITFQDKSRKGTPFEWLDDCPYHFAGRWEGVPFTYKIDAKGPDRAAITVTGGGKIAVALVRQLTAADVTNPLELKVSRTMSIEPGSTRLRVDVKITNVGEGVAPTFRYMVHAVFGNVPPMQGGRAFWFLPTSKQVEFFDSARGDRDMGESAGHGTALANHPFNRFTPERAADKPRYEAGGWGAVLTSAGSCYIAYDPKQFQFMQYWFGGDAEWHFTFEPHTRPVDLKPQESVDCSFFLAFDPKDIRFASSTVSYERPLVPDSLLPGAELSIQARATTVQNAEQAKVEFRVTDAAGQVLFQKPAAGELQPFQFTALGATWKLPPDAKNGTYAWSMIDNAGKELAGGKFEVVTAEEQTRRATARLTAQLEQLKHELSQKQEEQRRLDDLWKDGADLALTWNDTRVWGSTTSPRALLSVGIEPGAVTVLGDWKSKESARIQSWKAAAVNPWPADAEKMLSALGTDRALVRSVASTPDGKSLVALIVDAPHNRVQLVMVTAAGVGRRFGEFSDKPSETDGRLGSASSAIALDRQGNIWTATNAWGKTSVFRLNQDGSPYEEGVIGDKGALKKFSLEGTLLGAISLLDVPMDLCLADADGVPVVLAAYRHVTAYHGTQVREGILAVRASDAQRMAELKMPAGSVAVDDAGRIWSADVAGHIACFDARGRKLFDVTGSAAPAVPEATLAAGQSLPVIVRRGPGGSVWALATLRRSLQSVKADQTLSAAQAIPAEVGTIHAFTGPVDQPVVVGENSLWTVGK